MAITIPNTFVAGTKIEATPMNANFAETANAVDKRGDTLTGNLGANAGITVDGVDVSTIPNTSGTFNPLFAQVVIGTADTNGIRLDLESGTLAVREGDDSAYGPLTSGLLTTSGNHVPATNDGGSLGISGTAWADLFLASGAVINFNAGDVTVTHSTNTLTFAGASSGYVFNDGVITIVAGTAATPAMTTSGDLNTGVFFPAADTVGFATAGSERMRITSAGLVGINQPNPTEPLHVVGTARSTRARVADNDASGPSFAFQDDTDTGLFRPASDAIGFATGGTERMRLTGANVAIAATARLYLDGVAGTGDTYIYEIGANNIRVVAGGSNSASFTSTFSEVYGDFYVQAAKKLHLDGGGDTYFQEVSANVVNLYAGGTARFQVASAAISTFGTVGVGVYSSGSGTSTGTAIVRNGTDGQWYLTSSSRRFKENISTAVVTDAQLDAFMATAPSWWDYKGQKNGALGFIAEDLAALPLERYGCNPLVNYDAEGQIESNRDYALIAMHHLVIQRLERKIAALEARIH